MDNEQPAPQDSTPEQRLAAYFGADASEEKKAPELATSDVGAGAEAEITEPQEADEQPQEDSEGFEDIEIDGETYRVPPKLREAVLRQEDYTRKSQEVAEAKRQVLAQNQMLHLQQVFQQQAAPYHQELNRIQSQLAQYNQVDWKSLDTDTYLKAKGEVESLEKRAGGIQQMLAQSAQQFMGQAQQWQQQHLAQGYEYLRKAIPKFDQNTVGQLRSYAANEGFTTPEVDTITDPRFVRLLWKAQQFDAIKAGTKSAAEAVKKAPPVIRPGASQGQKQIVATKYKDARAQLKKSGSLADAAKLFERFT